MKNGTGQKLGMRLGAMVVSISIFLSQAQNLGLGAGSKPDALTDSSNQQGQTFSDKQEDAPPRKTQMNKRLGLSGRKGSVIDPKVFEARGRELQGQFYEIGGSISTTSKRTFATKEANQPKENRSSNQWLYWAGAAGVVGISAGAMGFYMLQKSHPPQPPPTILKLSDQ